LIVTRKEIYENLTPWQRVQVSRHPERPYTLAYIDYLTNGEFIELHGDRTVKDDKAIVGGFGLMDGQTVMFIGHQKGLHQIKAISKFWDGKSRRLSQSAKIDAFS
jgi:acetyl-CoA carboxylase carboxyl transferase subunit alpha